MGCMLAHTDIAAKKTATRNMTPKEAKCPVFVEQVADTSSNRKVNAVSKSSTVVFCVIVRFLNQPDIISLPPWASCQSIC